jgi:hypothetical protein
LHPRWRHSPEAKRALDLLLAGEIRERYHLGFEVARLIGAEESRGFLTFYARFDIAQVLDLCWRIGASLEDLRVAALVKDVKDIQGPYGLWEYQPKPQASRWVTFDLLRSLSRLTSDTDWITTEPPTPFSTYPRRIKRFYAARGALFEKTVPLDPPQKLFIKGGDSLQPGRIFMQTITAFGYFKVEG